MSEPQPSFSIEKIYLKGLSLEIPNAPQVFSEREPPAIDINLHNEVRTLDAGAYEVVLTATVTAKLKDKTAFLVEVAQAGVFKIGNLQGEQLDAVLGITCGNILFPYLRESIWSTVIRAGFPPFFLNHLSFEALYQQRLQQEREQRESQQSGAPPAA
jgi:preprotein translocase subunit SecB